MTLLELLDEAAECYGMPLGTGEKLRDARERLLRKVAMADAIETALRRREYVSPNDVARLELTREINGGPDPAPRVPQDERVVSRPESPKSPDPVEVILAVECEHCEGAHRLGGYGKPGKECQESAGDQLFHASRIRAASRRDTP